MSGVGWRGQRGEREGLMQPEQVLTKELYRLREMQVRCKSF